MDDEDDDVDVYDEKSQWKEKKEPDLTGKVPMTNWLVFLGSLYHYCWEIPVLGFNCARYDLNLVKSHLIPWLWQDLDPKKDDTCDVSVISMGSTYTQIGARWFKFLDISNYLTSGVSYSAFLKAYKIEEAKSYFPHEWFDHVSKLDFPKLPLYESFYSELKQKNVLEIRDSDYDEDPVTEIGKVHYQELQNIWLQQCMSMFKDFLIYYNILDANALYLDCIDKAMPCKGHVRQMGPDFQPYSVTSSSVAWRLTKSSYLPLTWNGCCRKDL